MPGAENRERLSIAEGARKSDANGGEDRTDYQHPDPRMIAAPVEPADPCVADRRSGGLLGNGGEGFHRSGRQGFALNSRCDGIGRERQACDEGHASEPGPERKQLRARPLSEGMSSLWGHDGLFHRVISGKVIPPKLPLGE